MHRILMDTLDIVDSESHPELFPPEVLKALLDVDKDPERNDHERMFRFKGWIIQEGLVGIRPDAPQSSNDEWMEYWRFQRDNPGVDA